MSDRVWTKIIFPAYAMRIAEVVKAIDQECPEDCDAGVNDQDAPDGALVAIADNTYGGFDILQSVLQKLRIPSISGPKRIMSARNSSSTTGQGRRRSRITTIGSIALTTWPLSVSRRLQAR